MRQKIHPKLYDVKITCGCGNVIETRSTKKEIAVEVCSKCHPFYTGAQKFVDTAGRVERFQKKYQWSAEAAKSAAEKPKTKG